MNLTQIQQQAVDSLANNRVTIVRAGPGSGKTRLFVEALRRELAASSGRHRGVAALSFTNVAHKEVSTRLGGVPLSPHFLGTLDSFFFRYIVRPFGPAAGISQTGARLVPEPQAKALHEPQVKTGSGNADWCNLFSVSLCGGTEEEPLVMVEDERTRNRRALSAYFAKRVVEQTKNEYSDTGRVSHSGVNYLASTLLSGVHADAIARLIEARFPVLLIDEVQDTGFFAGRALCSLLARSAIRCLIVGDPDQTIFKFSGASHDLFDRLEAIDGAKSHTLAVSHRCPQKTAAVSTSLSRSAKGVHSTSEAAEGEAHLVVYESKKPEYDRILIALGWTLPTTTVLVRRNSTARDLTGHKANWQPPGKSIAAQIHRAAMRLQNDDTVGAAKAISVALGKAVFSQPILGREELVSRKVAWSQWRGLCHAVLVEAAQQEAETWAEWLERVRTSAAAACERFGVPLEKSIKVAVHGFKEAEARKERCVATASPLQLGTIHSVKGREFPNVLLIVPKPHGLRTPCPSSAWWSDEHTSEEREIAFVACTRAQERLAIAVHETSFQMLAKTRPQFVQAFNVVKVPGSG